MRFLLATLFALCVFAGMNASVFAMGCEAASECCEVADPCCQDHQAGQTPQENHHDGDSCPVSHHHHTCCSHVMPMGADFQFPTRLGFPGSALLSFRHEGDLPPDGPFLGSEKPPLI